MPRLKGIWALAALLLLGACGAPTETASGPQPTPLETVVVSLTPAVRPLEAALEACAASQPEVALIVKQAPPGAAEVEDVDLAFRLGEPQEMPDFSAPVAWEQVVLALHPQNAVRAPTAEQLRALFGGRIRRWTELGGGGQRVQVWVALEEDEARRAFDGQVLQGGLVTPAALLAPSPEAVLEAVGENEGAVGYLPRAWATQEVRLVELDLRLPVLALADVEPEGPALDLLLCLQGESGQDFLADLYEPLD